MDENTASAMPYLFIVWISVAMVGTVLLTAKGLTDLEFGDFDARVTAKSLFIVWAWPLALVAFVGYGGVVLYNEYLVDGRKVK